MDAMVAFLSLFRLCVRMLADRLSRYLTKAKINELSLIMFNCEILGKREHIKKCVTFFVLYTEASRIICQCIFFFFWISWLFIKMNARDCWFLPSFCRIVRVEPLKRHKSTSFHVSDKTENISKCKVEWVKRR